MSKLQKLRHTKWTSDLRNMDTAVPIVDFAQYAVSRSDDKVVQRDIDQIASEMIEAFSSVGFVYLKNCGITDKEVSEVNRICAQFFTLPVDTKEPYASPRGRHGWVSLEREILNPERTPDLKESYDVLPSHAKKWPDKDVPGFQETMMTFYEKCSLLALRVLKAMAVGLNLKDTAQQSFVPCITQVCSRAVAHWVQNKAGEFIPAPPIPDTVVVNAADLMQRWTSDRLVSTKHRVMLPEDVSRRCETRQSLAFFANPDDDYLIKSLGHTQKYEPITAGDYLKQRFEDTFLY